MPKACWDGNSYLYSAVLDKYYENIEQVKEDVVEGNTISDLRIIICGPIYAKIDLEQFCHLISDGQDTTELEDAIDSFNETMSKTIFSWQPGKYALEIVTETE